VSDARHTPPGDASFRRSLLRNAGSAVGLVVLVAAVFWGIGSVGGPDDDTVAAGAADGETDDAADAGEPTEEPPADDPGEAAEDDAPAEDETATDDEPAEEPAEDAPDEGDEGDEEDGDDAEDEEEPARTVDPASVTVQVLDGVKDDGGAAADGVAGQLEGDGYQIIARNDALSYDVTTVLYNPGNEEAAQQIASDLGGAEVREQPGTLSTQVDLHVVVGRDRA
jgi:hypothetical protein